MYAHLTDTRIDIYASREALALNYRPVESLPGYDWRTVGGPKHAAPLLMQRGYLPARGSQFAALPVPHTYGIELIHVPTA